MAMALELGASPPHILDGCRFSNKCKPPRLINPFGARSKSARGRSIVGSTQPSKFLGEGNNYSSYSNYNDLRGSKGYTRLESCWVVSPPKGKRPSAIVKFLGGAFIGAVPDVTYSYLIELLASEGFVMVCVPYQVTFDHAQVAGEIYERFHTCLDKLLENGLPDAGLMPDDLVKLPFYSVGHSNGALLQVLVGSYFLEKIPKANVVISYNNRPATEAVPYFELLSPLLSQVMPIVETSPVYSLASSATGDAWKVLLDVARETIPDYDRESEISLARFADQLPSVFNQVKQGISEFKPTPAENRNFFKESYNVTHTLLVKFNSDAIDETDLLEETLKPRVKSYGGRLEKVSLGGNHLTPCIQEANWKVGQLYTPADAIAQGIRTYALNETRALSRTISRWFRNFDLS